jgi:membrane-associated phospholipid phosphatase
MMETALLAARRGGRYVPFTAFPRREFPMHILRCSRPALFVAILLRAHCAFAGLAPPNPANLENTLAPFTAPSSPVRNEVVGFFNNLPVQGSYPFRLAWRDPVRALVGAGMIAALVALDPAVHDATHFGRGSELEAWGQSLSKYGEGKYVLPLVAGFGVIGALGSRHEGDTAILLAESAVSAGLWTGAVKELTGRERPRETPEHSADWTGPGGMFAEDPVGDHTLQSFPSGHSSGTWAVATVLAHQYPQHHIVPLIAYGGAAAMSYARMVVGAHWLSDVVVGGLIGYGCAHQTIGARARRLAARDPAGPHSLDVSFDLHDGYRGIGLSYRF